MSDSLPSSTPTAMASSSESSPVFPETNFTAGHTVIINQPISKVFAILGTSEGHDRVTRLSKLCTDSQLYALDSVAIPRGTSLANSRVRHLPAADKHDVAFSNVINLPRQHFSLRETISIAFVLTKNVDITGTLTWDEKNRLALYESSTGGVTIWKLRKFTELQGDKTEVKETIEGTCSALMRSVVQAQTRKGHREHMESYHTLFRS